MTAPFFSFIIPVYNVQKYIEECVTSILNQDFNDYEIILVDDYSNDDSLLICQYLSSIDTRIVAISNHTNQGASVARNKGLERAKGDYVIFIDSDDYIDKTGTLLRFIYDKLKAKDIDVLSYPLISFNDREGVNNKIISKHNIKFINNISIIFNKRLFVASPCDKIIKRELIEKNGLKFPDGLLAEDITWSGNILKVTNNVLFFNIPFYFYRKQRVGSSTFQNNMANIEDSLFQLQENFKDINSYNINSYVSKFYAIYYMICLNQMVSNDNYSVEDVVYELGSMSLYLYINKDFRAMLLRNSINIIGFKNTIKLLKIYLKVKR